MHQAIRGRFLSREESAALLAPSKFLADNFVPKQQRKIYL
jgi:hypothetical protein